MKQFIFVVSVVFIFLGSCSIFQNETELALYAPKVSFMKIGFDDRYNSTFSNLEDVTVYMSFLISLEEPERYSSISQIKIITPAGNTWTYLDDQVEGYWEEDRGRFAFWNRYSSSRPDFAQLGVYTVRISENGKSDSIYYMTAIANNDLEKNVGNVYCKASNETPYIIEPPSSVVIGKIGNNSIDVNVTGIDESISYVFIWIYGNGTYLGTYDIAWPLEESQYPNLSITTVLTENEYINMDNIVVGFISEQQLDQTPDQRMLYRYFYRVLF